MDQDRPAPAGFGTTSGSDTGSNISASSGVCDHCGQAVGQSRTIEQFLGKLGISDDMISSLKGQMQNVDIDEYINTAREYLKSAGDKVKPVSEKAKAYTKDNPGKVAAGVAILAVGAGLLINSMREK